jgi:putative transcriptional regulator
MNSEDDVKKEHFDSLLDSIGEARSHARGEAVTGLKVHTRKVERSAIAAVRLKAGLTQVEFARLLGASLGTIRKWEMGERSPSGAAATLLRVLDFDPTTVTRALGVTPEQPKRMPRSGLVEVQ